MKRILTWLVLVSALAACAGMERRLPPPPVRLNGQTLWRIIHDQCVPAQRSRNEPAPCVLASMASGEARGYVVLKDRTGIAQYLLMPTAKITGIEDPSILDANAVNYFAKAWEERHFVEDRLGHPLSRIQVSIAVNSIYGRTQDQLHLHIDCLDRTVGAALQAADIPSAARWADRTIQLKGRSYRVHWLDGAELDKTNPFDLLAQTMPGARRTMGAWTIALVGAVRADGTPGFYLLADRADPASGDPGSAEDLQDHACQL